MNSLCISTLFFISLYLGSTPTRAANFNIRNNCPYTIWAAAIPGGGQQLNSGQTWNLTVAPGTTGSRIWARTNCTFDSSGHGSCETGDCGGVLQCTSFGRSPNTIVEFALNQFNTNADFYDISLVDGFNVPAEFTPNSSACRGTRCVGDINGQCPKELKAPGGCNSPCNVFKTDPYCCFSGGPCAPTTYSRFFKEQCPEAYTINSGDGGTSTLTCAGGTNYRVVFCP